MATRSAASVLRAIRQPSPHSPTTQSSGTYTCVEEDLVEERTAR